jgi:transposase
MTSDKKAEANRRNALKSTGPKTPDGKAAVRLNALKHGLRSEEILLWGEDEDALRELGERLRNELQPAGELENLLVDRIIASYWRLRRVGRVEAGIFAWEHSEELAERAEREAQGYESNKDEDLMRVIIPFRFIDGIMECMPKILYSQVIEEDPRELKELEKHHRYTHLFQRVRMLRLLKSEECRNLGEAAEALGYSWRQCQRWFASYRNGGIEELLRSRVSERGRQELVTEEAFEDLEEAMKRGEIATISEADQFLRLRHGIEYSHPDGVGQLLRRRKVK